MNNSRKVETDLYSLVDDNNYLLSYTDLRALLPNISDKSFKSIIYRMCKNGYITRLIKNIYIFKFKVTKTGNILSYFI